MKVLVFCALAVCLCGHAVEAQTMQRPSRPYRGLFGGGPPPDPQRSRQELTLSGSLLAGYDDYLSPGGGVGPIVPGGTARSAVSGYADADLSYFVGKAVRSFAADANVFSNTYSGSESIVGGGLQLVGRTGLGRRNNLELGGSLDYTPTLMLGAFGGLQADVDPQLLPETSSASGLVNHRSWGSSTSVTLTREWTTRQSTVLHASYATRAYLDDLGYDTSSHGGNFQHSWRPTRTLMVGGGYYLNDSESQQSAQDAFPMQNHTVEGTASYTRRLSPTRELTIGGGLGATYVDTLDVVDRQPQSYWMPSGHASFSVGLGRSWVLATDYRRSVNVLTGISLESFATDAASVRTNGTFGGRIEAALSAAFSNGRTAYGDRFGRFESYGGSAQLRYAMARCCALSVNYDYYYYFLRDLARLVPGVPPQYDHNAVRVGLSFWLPLYGSYRSETRTAGAGGR